MHLTKEAVKELSRNETFLDTNTTGETLRPDQLQPALVRNIVHHDIIVVDGSGDIIIITVGAVEDDKTGILWLNFTPSLPISLKQIKTELCDITTLHYKALPCKNHPQFHFDQIHQTKYMELILKVLSVILLLVEFNHDHLLHVATSTCSLDCPGGSWQYLPCNLSWLKDKYTDDFSQFCLISWIAVTFIAVALSCTVTNLVAVWIKTIFHTETR